MKGPSSMYSNIVHLRSELPASAESADANHAHRALAVESMVVTNMASAFLNRFAPIKTFLEESFSFGGDAGYKRDPNLTNVENGLCRRVTGENFASLYALPVACAPGWRASFADAKPLVADILADMKGFINNVLQPHYLYLSIFLTNKDSKEKGHDASYMYKKLEAKRKSDAEHRAQYFDSGNQGTIPFGELFDRAADLPHAFNDVATARKQFGEVDFVAIKSKITDIVTLLDEIMLQLNEGKIESIPSDTAKTMSDGTYEIARQAEFMSANALVVMNYLGLGNNVVVALQDAEKAGTI